MSVSFIVLVITLFLLFFITVSSFKVNEDLKLDLLVLLAWPGLLSLEHSLSCSSSSQDVGLLSVSKRPCGYFRLEWIELENAAVIEFTELIPVLAVLFVLNSSDVDKISDVDVKAVILQVSDLLLVVQVNKVDFSSSASFRSWFLSLDDLATLANLFLICCAGNESKSCCW